MSTLKWIITLFITLSALFAGVQLYFHFKGTSVVAANKTAYLNTIHSRGEFAAFEGAPLDEAYPTITSVKAVYDLKRKEIYFINSHMYRLHYDFCSKVLGYNLGLGIFNVENYGSERNYYLANINYLNKTDQYVLEFSSTDEIDSVQIAEMYHKVSASPLFAGNLFLLLNNSNTLTYFAAHASVRTITPNALHEGLSYQPIQPGSCTGRLVLCNDLKAQYLDVLPGDILVVKGSPTEIPLCKAVISDCFQTPLSHIQVLSHNKNMPSAYLQNVFSDARFEKLNGQYVELSVTADSLSISPASPGNVLNSLPQKNVLPLNTSLRRILPLAQCDKLTSADIGTKAKGLSDLRRIAEAHNDLFQIPQGAFVIPFYFYRQHLQNAGAAPLLARLEACPLTETEKMNALLRQIRKAILRTPVSPALLRDVELQIRKNNCGNSYRFRSSSNAEDLPDFSGAGLYDSKTGETGNAKKPIDKAIKKVWAGMYNYRAYRERRFAGIVENTAAMSILAHRNFPDEEVNGVIITQNNYRKDYPGIVVNAQLGDVSTVSPPDSVQCEQFILVENKYMNPLSDKVSAKYICFSSLHPNSPLMTYTQLLRLQKSVNAVIAFYANRHAKWDVEFKFDGDVLYFKQVRPYR
jgi:pyruvate, water dikinase